MGLEKVVIIVGFDIIFINVVPLTHRVCIYFSIYIFDMASFIGVNMIKVIIFDYGNVVGNNPNTFIFKGVSKEFGIDCNEIEHAYRKLIPRSQKDQISEKDFWIVMSLSLGIDDPYKIREVWTKEYIKNSKIDKKVVSFVRRLRNWGYNVCLLSNMANFYREISLSKEIEKEFSEVFYSYQLGARKQEDGIYKIIVDKLHVEPQECIFIDDEEEALRNPREIGIETILYQSLDKLESELKEML